MDKSEVDSSDGGSFLSVSYLSDKKFRADCKRRKFNIQNEGNGLILAFAAEEYMGSFNGKEGFLLEETMIKPFDKQKYLH